MSENPKKNIKFCVFCGEDIGESKTYCPNCGKLIVKLKEDGTLTKPPIVQRSDSTQTIDISRVCPGCGSIISSTIIDQCPICNTPLEKLSEAKKEAITRKPGLIFTNKKLEPEQKFILKKDVWNFKEGLNVFGTCIYTYIIVYFIIAGFQVLQKPLLLWASMLPTVPGQNGLIVSLLAVMWEWTLLMLMQMTGLIIVWF